MATLTVLRRKKVTRPEMEMPIRNAVDEKVRRSW